MNELIKEELELIRKTNNGFLRPQEIVEFAKNSETALHSQFTWDDTEAAQKYRLAQARAIIRVAVIVDERSEETVRTYVSLTQDRHDEGGYRATVEVLNDDMLAEALMQDALKELNTFKRKYEKLSHVSGIDLVFKAIDKLPQRRQVNAEERAQA